MMGDSNELLKKDIWDTIIVGGGQAGLATGYFLSRMNIDYVILDAAERTGDSWSKRWDSLRTFTPAWANGLPGMAFPGPKGSFPTKDEVAAFLAYYKETYRLPVIHSAKVIGLHKTSMGFALQTKGRSFYAKSVIIATGNYAIPKIPEFAWEFRPEIRQLHSSAYTSASGLGDGDVLVVGAGTSGLQIALDLAPGGRKIYVSGNPPARIPDFVFKYLARQFVWFATHILNTGTPLGRKAQYAIRTEGKAAPLINISLEAVKKAGIEHLPRLHGAKDGWPALESGRNIHVRNIIWATGFSPDYSWIKIPVTVDGKGYPLTKRGVSVAHAGLFFVGSAFQYALTSTWIGGVGRDAEFIASKVREYNGMKSKAPVQIIRQTAGDGDPYASRR